MTESLLSNNGVEQLILAMATAPDVLAAVHSVHGSEKEDSWFSYDEQEILAESIAKCWSDSYSPSDRYFKSLVKLYVSSAEAKGIDIESDSLMDLVLRCSLLKNTPPEPNESCYLSFCLPNVPHSLLKIRVFPFHNDVALRLWEAGATLAEFFVANPGWVQGKSVIELGAGVGLTGLVIAGCCEAKAVCLTDYTDVCRKNMDHNIVINNDWLMGCGRVHEDYLEWSTFSETAESSGSRTPCEEVFRASDVLIAADVTYDVSELPCLVAVVRQFLNGSKQKAFFGITRRNMATFDTFLGLLEREGIHYEWIADGQTCSNLPILFPCTFNQERSDVRIALLTRQL